MLILRNNGVITLDAVGDMVWLGADFLPTEQNALIYFKKKRELVLEI
jgi:hypothetical protein